MRHRRTSTAGQGFSLIELIVAMTVFALMMGIVGSVVTQARDTWSNAASRVSHFRDARVAFELITRNVSQSTLNTYLDYQYTGADDIESYARKSELHFVTGNAGTGGSGTAILTDQTEAVRPSHAIFFQAYLGHTQNPDLENLGSLLNGRGYYIQYTDGTELAPGFMGAAAPPRWRYRLWEWMPTSEQFGTDDGNEIYTQNPTSTDWFNADTKLGWLPGGGNDGTSRLVAENVIALFVSPRSALPEPGDPTSYADAVNIAPTYSYDSRSHGPFGATNSLQHLLPPLVEITLVAIDEAAVSRINPGPTPPAYLQNAALSGLFTSSADYKDDLETLEETLTDMNINYRVFSTTIALRSGKWDATSVAP